MRLEISTILYFPLFLCASNAISFSSSTTILASNGTTGNFTFTPSGLPSAVPTNYGSFTSTINATVIPLIDWKPSSFPTAEVIPTLVPTSSTTELGLLISYSR